MSGFVTFGNKALAAVSSLVITALIMATVIAPANNGVLLPGVIA